MYRHLLILAPLTFMLMLMLSTGAFNHARAQSDTGSDYPTYDPSQELYMELNAELLAEDIKHLYGGEYWNDSLKISFDYVAYTKDSVELLRYHQEWNRLTDEALLTGRVDDGRPFEVRFSSLSRMEGMMLVDSIPVRTEYLPSAMQTAYNQLMLNTRWLFLPVQLLDSNVTLHRLKDTVVGGKRASTLKVTFEKDSGMANVYFLVYVNPTYKNIERWRISNNGSEKDYIWRLYRRIDPFLLSTKRWAEDFETYIQFENINVQVLDKTTARLEKQRSD